MRLTIVPSDGVVLIDNYAYHQLDLSNCAIPNNVHALQWYNTYGEIEFVGTIENEQINELPDWANLCVDVWNSKDYLVKNPPPEQLQIVNEQQAKNLLLESDWTQLADVNIVNKAAWNNYRAALRNIATNPTPNAVFPSKPEVIWE